LEWSWSAGWATPAPPNQLDDLAKLVAIPRAEPLVAENRGDELKRWVVAAKLGDDAPERLAVDLAQVLVAKDPGDELERRIVEADPDEDGRQMTGCREKPVGVLLGKLKRADERLDRLALGAALTALDPIDEARVKAGQPRERALTQPGPLPVAPEQRAETHRGTWIGRHA
jgi:hypothetical protein